MRFGAQRPITTWASLAPSDLARYTAFAHRVSVPLLTNDAYLSALTHPSFPTPTPPPTTKTTTQSHTRLQLLGSSSLSLYTAEHLLYRYPTLPTPALESLLKSYTGQSALGDVAEVLGMKSVMRWVPVVEDGRTGGRTVGAKVVQAFIGAVYVAEGPKAARDFIKKHILSRTVEVPLHLSLNHPKHQLFLITESLNRLRPISRLLKESGRLSASPVFLVGIYSGMDKLGEGYGSSLAMAEERAAKDALMYYYAKECNDVGVPSDMEQEDITFFEE